MNARKVGDGDNGPNVGQRPPSVNNRSLHQQCFCMPNVPGPIGFPPNWTKVQNNDAFCDGFVYCDDGSEFQISRVILSAVSPYFRALFTNSINRNQPEKNVASINAPGSIFTKMMDYANTGQCQIDKNTLVPLMQYADQYDMPGILRLCFQFIIESMKPTNCLRLFCETRRFFCKHLNDRCLKYIGQHFTEAIRESTELDLLSVEEITALLRYDRLNVDSEKIAFDAVQKWLQYDESRIKHLTTLLSSIRLGHLDDVYLQYILQWPPISENPECQTLIRSVMQLLKNPMCDLDVIRHPQFRPRVSNDILFLIGGRKAGIATSCIETYDSKVNRWFIYRYIGAQRVYHGVCTLDGIIYVIGGSDGKHYYSTTLAFNPVTHSVRYCSCMNYPRSHVAVVAHAGKIYAIGGRNRTVSRKSRLKYVECYDPISNQWELVQPMLTQRSGAGAACVNGKIYVVGGFSGTETLASSEIYDPVLNQWSYGPSMSTGRAGLSLVQFDGTLYALGGTKLRTGERLTPSIENAPWIPINSMQHPRSNFSAVVLERSIVAIGGDNGVSNINFVESYNIEEDVWEEISPINDPTSGTSACVVCGLKNSIDYSFVGHLLRRNINFGDQ